MNYRITVKKLAFGLLTVFGLATQANAQDDLNKLVSQYKSDGNYLITSYIDPFMKTLNLSLNQGWYNTAKPHKVAGVDLTITVNAMYIPTSDKSYNVSNLQQIELKPGQTQFTGGTVPTIFGKEETPVYRPKNNTDPSAEFSGPQGIDLKKNVGINAIPVPMAQLGFGLPKGFDVKLRFCPTIKFGDNKKGNVQMFGLGVMHDIKQYFPGIKLLPFDLSAFVGYTQIKLNYDMSGEVAGVGQKAEYNISATTIQGVISKKISVLTVYGGLGYNIAKSHLAIKGTYDTDNDDNANGPNDVKDPYKHDFAASGPRVSAGARLKLAVFTFHADYTVQKYSCLTVGFGISVR